MKITIKTTKIYEKSIAKLLSKEMRYEMENQIAMDPLHWPVIRGTGGIRKARFARDGVGKRGGGRACYLYITVHETIYFLSAYAKNEKDDLSDQDKKKMKNIVEQILEIIGDL
jgi:hypothetical protein